MVRPAGFEPATSSVGDWRSIQLSYGREVPSIPRVFLLRLGRAAPRAMLCDASSFLELGINYTSPLERKKVALAPVFLVWLQVCSDFFTMTTHSDKLAGTLHRA